jgi:hypothetical protein
MPGFYNPYDKNPQWGQGISGIMQQMMQMQWLKKMFENPTAPKESNKEQPPTDKNPVQIDPGLMNAGGMPSPTLSPASGYSGQKPGLSPMDMGGGGGMMGLDPQMKMIIMQLIQQFMQGQGQQQQQRPQPPQMYGRPRQ